MQRWACRTQRRSSRTNLTLAPLAPGHRSTVADERSAETCFDESVIWPQCRRACIVGQIIGFPGIHTLGDSVRVYGRSLIAPVRRSRSDPAATVGGISCQPVYC